MYDFSMQKAMLSAAVLMLKENGLLKHSALGGGTALSAVYWQHRFSTDIDMFIQKNSTGSKDCLVQRDWSEKVSASLWEHSSINITR